LVERIVLEKETNLFKFILNSIRETCESLAIGTEIVVSSSLRIDHSLPGKAKVLALCRHVGADLYINAIGGRDLYSKEDFSAHGIRPGSLCPDFRSLRADLFLVPAAGRCRRAVRQLLRLRRRRSRRPDEDPRRQRSPDPGAGGPGRVRRVRHLSRLRRA